VRGTAETRLIPHWNDSKLASSEVDEPSGSFFGLKMTGIAGRVAAKVNEVLVPFTMGGRRCG
jgi:hypothetical protein